MKPRTKLIWGVILVFIGIVSLGETTGYFCIEDVLSKLFPLAFIVLGVWLIARRKKPTEPSDAGVSFGPPPPPPPVSPSDSTSYAGPEPTPETGEPELPGPGPDNGYSSSNYDQARLSEAPGTDESGKLKYSKTFGDMFIDFTGVNVQNVEVSAGIGDLEMKLNGAQLVDGLNRLIVSSFIGDIRIFTAANMAIYVHCSNFVGDIEVMGKRATGFGNSIDSQTADYQASPKKLYIACNSFIGDIKIYGV